MDPDVALEINVFFQFLTWLFSHGALPGACLLFHSIALKIVEEDPDFDELWVWGSRERVMFLFLPIPIQLL